MRRAHRGEIYQSNHEAHSGLLRNVALQTGIGQPDQGADADVELKYEGELPMERLFRSADIASN